MIRLDRQKCWYSCSVETLDCSHTPAAGAGEVVEEFLGFYGISYMQDMTPAICEKARIGETARLIDNRDQQLYWVAKLRDGNCWMTQNLAYDGAGELITKPDQAVPTGALVYKMGQYVYTTPNVFNECRIDGAYPTSLSQCTTGQYGWVDVSKMNAFDTTTNGVIVDDTANLYDAHYLPGNVYDYGAVLNACPDGWELPNGVVDSEKSYAPLLSAYGITNFAISQTTGIDVRLAPLYFFTSGTTMYDNSNWVITFAGYRGMYWAKKLDNGTIANLDIAPWGLSQNPGWGSGVVMPVRCVAR